MKKLISLLLVIFCVSIITSCESEHYDLPAGWYVAGSHPKDYVMGTDNGAGKNGNNAATIKSKSNGIDGFGTLMQSIDPQVYKNKHLKMSAFMKTQNVKDWAGFWIRVDGQDLTEPLSFDNMYDRPLKGDKDWTKCEIVVNVPQEASGISFGALLHGTGQIWFDDINFEAVDTTVALTGTFGRPTAPKNLNFDNN